MAKLRDSSELQEAMSLLGEIIEATRRQDAADARQRGIRLQRVLEQMCARGGFRSAAVSDRRGLLLADQASALPVETIGALCAVLGETLQKVEAILASRGIAAIAVDLDLADKFVVRRFMAGDDVYYLIITCPQDLDERGEMEVTLDEIGAIIGPR